MGFFSNLDIAIHEAMGTPKVQAGRILPGDYFWHNNMAWRRREGWADIDGILRIQAERVDTCDLDGYFLPTELVTRLDV